MKTNITDFVEFHRAICADKLVFIFGAGISSALSNSAPSWYRWIQAGIATLSDFHLSASLQSKLESSKNAADLIDVVGNVLEDTRRNGTYDLWMHESFETAQITNSSLAYTLRKLTIFNDVFATTNYDRLLERATGLQSLSYEQPAEAVAMLQSGQSNYVLHIHGIYDSVKGIDNIVASQDQYDAVLNDKGAQFIQQILGTRTMVFIGCGKTTEDVNVSQFVDFAREYLKMDQDYYFLYKSSSPVTELPDNIHPIPYGDDYADLPDFLEDMAQERIKRKLANNRLIGRTAFDCTLPVDDNILKYHYAHQLIPFCGRDVELSKLREFICSEGTFSWWAITGQAGAGKSRLAFEFIRQLPPCWFGFFVNDNTMQSDVEQYKPFCNTLAIIDYVSGRERQVAEIISGLRDIFSSFQYKLRIILLERDNNRETGSWYSRLYQRCGRIDASALKAAEYRQEFLRLDDLIEEAVKIFISAVCALHNLKDDTIRDNELYNLYKAKFERLQFRPLYLQMFVESWIANDFETPKYDDYTGLLEELLKREQVRWLSFFDGNQAVCNACIRLLVRANIAPLKVDNIPDLYKSDLEKLRAYISSHAFSGKQKRELQKTLINSLCQNIDEAQLIIAPQFPDIIKEYMFMFYTDEEQLPWVMQEIWMNAAAPFSTFIKRCLMDFEDQDFYQHAINAYDDATSNLNVLLGRQHLLDGRLIQKGEDPQVFWDLIDNEYKFWSTIVVPEGDQKDMIATAKVSGLYKVAQNIGAWSLYDVSPMIEVIDELLAVNGGNETELTKRMCLQESITSLSTHSFFDEASYLRNKFNNMIKDERFEDLDNLYSMHSFNDEMMAEILHGKFYDARRVLRNMEAKCHKEQIESARILAHSCFNIDNMAFKLEETKYIGTGLPIVSKLEQLHPDDWQIRARRIGCETVVLQKKLFIDGNKDISVKLSMLESDLDSMEFENEESREAIGMTWGLLKSLKGNIASESELRKIITEATRILKNYPNISEIAATKILATRILHDKFLYTKVTHDEVENLFKLVEENYVSESVRREFFELLSDSEDAEKKSEYLNQDIIREAFQTAKYNPLMDSGIPEIDLMLEQLDEVLIGAETYVRGHNKVGRNDPCPCGSGKKFKKCCLGKGIYD